MMEVNGLEFEVEEGFCNLHTLIYKRHSPPCICEGKIWGIQASDYSNACTSLLSILHSSGSWQHLEELPLLLPLASGEELAQEGFS